MVKRCIDCGKEILGKVVKEMCQICYNRKWREKNPEKTKASYRRCYKNNLERIKKHKTGIVCINCNKEIIGKIIKRMCKKCYYKKWKKENPEKAKAGDRHWRENNKQKCRILSKKWKKENFKKVAVSNKKYREKNSDKIKAKSKKWQKENPYKVRATSKKWRGKNIEKARVACRKWYKENPIKIKQYNNKPHINISLRLRCRIRNALSECMSKGKVRSSDEYGINYKAILKYLEPFPKDRHLYHIDHIRPLCSFNFINKDGTQNLEEIKKAFAPENHQWLLIKENLSKGGKWNEN